MRKLNDYEKGYINMARKMYGDYLNDKEVFFKALRTSQVVPGIFSAAYRYLVASECMKSAEEIKNKDLIKYNKIVYWCEKFDNLADTKRHRNYIETLIVIDYLKNEKPAS